MRKTRFDQLAEREKGIEIAAGLKLRSSLALPSWLRYGLKEYKEQLKYPKTRDKFTWYCHLMRKGPLQFRISPLALAGLLALKAKALLSRPFISNPLYDRSRPQKCQCGLVQIGFESRFLGVLGTTPVLAASTV